MHAVMNTPDINNTSPSPPSPTTSDDFSLFEAVILAATAPDSPLEERFRNAAAGVVRSYRYVTESGIDSSSQESTSRSTSDPASSQTTYSKAGLGSDNLRSDNLRNSNTSWSENVASPAVVSRSWSTKGFGPSTVNRPFSRLDNPGNTIRVQSDADDVAAVPPTTSEVWGWLLCEVGMSGFKAMLWVFFPLLIFSLFAATRGFMDGTAAETVHCPYNVTDRDPRCLRVCDSFTKDLINWTSGSLGGNETRSAGVTILEILSARSWQPAALIAGMLGASVVVQLVLFTISSPVLDYGKRQRFVLWLGTGIGSVAAVVTICLFRAEWWWICGILFLFSTVGVGLVSTWLDSYLSSLARGIPILRTQLFDKVQIFQSVRIRFVYKLSLTGVIVGCLSATLCTMGAFFFLRSSLVPKLMGIRPNNWSLRIACCIGGIWLVCWTAFPNVFLLKEKPGPSFKFIAHPVAKHFLMAVFGMRIGQAGKGRSGLLLLLVCFLSSMGNATVFQSGFLCFSLSNFIKFALMSQLSSLVGTIVFLFVQISLSWSSKVMLLIALLVHLLLPIYGCIGFFLNTTSGKKSKLLDMSGESELLVFAFAYGVCLGAHRSYIRTLFRDCVPGPTSVGAYFSFLALVNQFSTFVGSLEMLLFVRYNGDLRYIFVIMGAALLLASMLMVTYMMSISKEQDFDGTTDSEVSFYNDANSIKTSVEDSSTSTSDQSSSVQVPMSLRKQFSPGRYLEFSFS